MWAVGGGGWGVGRRCGRLMSSHSLQRSDYRDSAVWSNHPCLFVQLLSAQRRIVNTAIVLLEAAHFCNKLVIN